MIYLDHHASTPCDPQVVQAMLPFFTSRCGNAGIGLHAMGREANEAVEAARTRVAACVGSRVEDVVFTSGATESNNLTLLSLSRAGLRRKVVTTVIEHKSVLGPCEALAQQGFEVSRLPVDRFGRASQEAAREAVDEQTLLVSVQAANNEIGTVQNVKAFADIAHAKGALFHCDAAQALGKIPLDVEDMNLDFASFSAHKIHGPKGIGALFVRSPLRSGMNPLMHGGAQEGGLRPGTMPVPLCVGFGAACQLARDGFEQEVSRLTLLRDQMQKRLMEALPDSRVNGDPLHRLPTNISLTIPGVDGESLALALRGVALSTGAACNSGAQEPSYILRALGLTWEDALSTIRIGVGRFNTEEEIAHAAAEIADTAKRLVSGIPPTGFRRSSAF